MKVVIKSLRGETGLRLPGTILSVSPKTAKLWIKNKWAEEIKPVKKKELKAEIETKELKTPKKGKYGKS